MRLAALALCLLATPALASDPFAPLAGLMGEWVNDGAPSEGTGYFSLAADLENHVLVRKNHAEYPAVKDRPAGIHDDLMIVYPAGTKLRAHYFDNEGHVIEYDVVPAADGKNLVLTSTGPGPIFRLTYERSGAAAWAITFEMAMPEKPTQFRKLVSGKVHRK